MELYNILKAIEDIGSVKKWKEGKGDEKKKKWKSMGSREET